MLYSGTNQHFQRIASLHLYLCFSVLSLQLFGYYQDIYIKIMIIEPNRI